MCSGARGRGDGLPIRENQQGGKPNTEQGQRYLAARQELQSEEQQDDGEDDAQDRMRILFRLFHDDLLSNMIPRLSRGLERDFRGRKKDSEEGGQAPKSEVRGSKSSRPKEIVMKNLLFAAVFVVVFVVVGVYLSTGINLVALVSH
jgi:hypothetical protein